MFRKSIIAAAVVSVGLFAQAGAAFAMDGYHHRHHAAGRASMRRGHDRYARYENARHAYRHYASRFRRHHARRAFDIGSPRATALLQNYVASTGSAQQGRASYYSGGRTASGGSVGAATCAHRSLPFGTRVLVTNLANARQVVLTVNDRGPFVGGRILDVSRTAAGMLGMIHSGVSQIRMQVLGGAG